MMASFRWRFLDATNLLMLRSSLVTLAVITASMTNAQTTTITQPYSAVSPACGSTSNLTGNGNVTSPYYPNFYPNNAYCTWSLTASPGKILQLTWSSFELETNYDYLYVTSQVANKSTPYSNRFTGNNPSNYSLILGATASLTFSSDGSVQRQGFVLTFRSIAPPAVNRTAFTECGGNLTGSGIISSPKYLSGAYPSNSRCIWSVRASDGQVLRFFFNSYDVEYGFDTVLIYNSTSLSQGAGINYTSYQQQNMYWSQFNSEAVVVFTSDDSVEMQGFQLSFISEYASSSYTTAATSAPLEVCGGNLNGEGIITSPGYLNNSSPYTWCSWTITAANGSALLIEFLDFALDKQYSYLNIWDSVFYNGYYLSGSDSNVTPLYLSSQVSLYYSSYNYGSSRGFMLRFRSVATRNSTNSSSSYLINRFTSCGSNLTNQGNFTSPNYPAQYPNNAYCMWNITASPGKVLQLFCLSFNLESGYDSVQVASPLYNKATVKYNWLSGNSSNCSLDLGTTATVSFYSDATVRGTGFAFGFRSVTPPTVSNRTAFAQCGGNLTGAGYISSPNYPGEYPSNSRCIWRLKAFDGQALRLYIYEYDVEDIYDTLVIYNSANLSQGAEMNYTSYWQQNMYWRQFNSEVIIVFASDESEERRGFNLYFTSEYTYFSSYSTTSTPANSIVCGSNLTGNGNITSPNYPNFYPNNAYCTWSLTASPGKILQLICNSFDLESNYDNLYITSQVVNKSTAYSNRFTGSLSLCSLILGATASLTFTSDGSVQHQGFVLNFRSIVPPAVNRTAFTECGGNLTGSGIISSPKYFSGAYPSNSRCIWRVRAFDGQVLRFSFNSYDVEDGFDTVLIYNSTSLSQGAGINYTSYQQQNMYWRQFNSEAVVVFTSDESVERQGFQLSFTSEYASSGYTTAATTAPLEECGGNLNGEGIITSPGYSNNSSPRTRCEWTLTAANGSAILIEFLDFALDKQYSYLSIWDNVFYNSYYLSGTDSNVTSLYLSSQVSLYYGNYNYGSSRGFVLRFRSVASRNSTNSSSSYLFNRFTSCGSNLTNQGNFTSPNYPAQYPNNAYCMWNITASPGKVLQLFCLSFNLEDSYDSVQVTSPLYNKTTVKYNWLSGNSRNCSWDLGATATVSFYSDATVRSTGFAFGFRSVPLPAVSNRTAFTQCGGNLTGSGYISSPNYPGVYPSNSRCIWRLKAFDGQALRLYINEYDVEDSYDTLLIYNSANLSQGAAMNYTSYWQQNMYWTQFNSEVIIMFASDESEDRRGFNIYFSSEYTYFSSYSTTSTPASSIACGSNLTGNGNITSPNYPNFYPNYAYCTWSLTASPGKILQLTCNSFDLETNFDYLYVTSQVANKSTAYSNRFTGNSSNCSLILGATASLTFFSDGSVQRQGFVLTVRSIVPPAVNRTAFTACGGNLTGSGTVSSPNYPGMYPSNSRCIWRLRAAAGQVLRLNFDSYDVENAYDSVIIYNSNNISQSAAINYTSYSQQGMYSTQFNSEVLVVFTSDESVERSGFQLSFYSEYSYWATTTAPFLACGGNLYGEGNLTTPGYPNNFPAYSSCSWTITAANGSVILLEFLDFALDKQSSYLSIHDYSPSYRDYYLSGTDSNLTSLRLSSQASLYFVNYNYGSSRGFSLKFKSVAAPNASNSSWSYNVDIFRSCGSNLTNQGNFTSPNYPASYPNNANCVWNISASPGKVLQLYCISLDLENGYDYVFVSSQVYNKTTIAFNWLTGNSTNGNCLMNLGASATVAFNSDSTVRRQGFVFGFRSVIPPAPVNRTAFTECGGNLTGSGTFSSPNFPGTYPSNSRCTWRLRASDGHVLRLYFYFYDVEDSYDSVIIYNSRDISQGSALNYTSYLQQNMYWTQFNSEVIVTFTSDENFERSGFEIYFTSEYQSLVYSTTTTAPYSCGGEIYREGNISSPNYPYQYPGSFWCSWNVYSSSGSSLVIQFVDLDIVKGSDWILIVTNGSFASYGGNDVPRTIRGGSTANIHFLSAILSNSTLPRRGFMIQIYSTTNSSNLTNTEKINDYITSCGGNFTGKGNLTSPGYPALYPNKAYCSYSLTAQSANHSIVLRFSTFDLEQNFDYLYVYSWSGNISNSFYLLPLRFTGNNLPSTLVLQDQATIVFASDFTVRGRGFFASFTSVPANSTSTLVSVPSYTTATPVTNRTQVQTSSSLATATTPRTTPPTTKLTTIVTTKITTKQPSPTAPTSPIASCGRVLYNGAEFASPNYPAGYPNDTICNWTLIASPGKVVLLSFQVFALESGADYLRIYNGTDISWKSSFISYTGFSVPSQLTLTESVTVVFISDESLSFPGFRANFTSVTPRGGSNATLTSTPTPLVCGGSLGAAGEIASPNFPYAYPNEVSCAWTFTVPRGGGYRFEFLNFTTEQFWDNVVIRAGAVEITRVSGSQLPAAIVIVSSGNISFTSDESVQMSGFRIRYSRLASATTPRTTVKPTTPSLGVCGQAVTDMRVQNARILGAIAPAYSIPWQVMIVRAATNFSGVLLNNRWVLTASSNLKATQATAYSLLLGKQRSNAQEDGQQRVSAVQIVRNPQYNSATGDGDLALIRLTTPVNFTTTIRPICLPTATVKAGDVCFASGWGATNGSTPNSAFLRVAQVTIINTQSCINYIQTFTKNQICGGYIGGGQDVCQGDAGGPLVYFTNGRYQLQGITSTLTSCGKPFSPSAFTAVSPYVSWINSVIN